MEKLKQYKYIILMALLILGFIFYWFELKPYLIKKSCFKEALPIEYADPTYNLTQHLAQWRARSDEIYTLCLKRNGM